MSACHACSHAKSAHEHYRAGTDCSECDCARFRKTFLPSFRLPLVRHAAPTPDLLPHRDTTAA